MRGNRETKDAATKREAKLSRPDIKILKPKMPKRISALKAKVYSNPHAAMYLSDKHIRDEVKLYRELIIDFSFAVFKFIVGMVYRSPWLVTVAVYYTILGGMQTLLIRSHRTEHPGDNRDAEMTHKLKTYRLCGLVLILLDIVMAGVQARIIWLGTVYRYHEYLIYAFALYAFYYLITAAIEMVKYRHVHNPVFSASKNIGLTKGLMSMFTLQTVMLAQFATEEEEMFVLTMNLLSGTAVCTIVLIVAITMVIKANRRIRSIRNPETANNSEII